MFNPIIETAIGLVFVYLLLSMICSALQEWIATLLGLRAKTLFQGITQILCGDANLRDQIYAHPLVKGLSRTTWLDKLLRRPARPSYISPETFSKAFLAAVALPEAIANNATPLNANNGEPLHENTKDLIDALHDLAPGSIDRFRANLESWYNDAMDRVSGWYKRKTQGMLLVLALGVAAASNADTLMLVRAFWSDPSLRAGVVAAAQQYVKEHPNGVDSPSVVGKAQNPAHSSTTGEQPSRDIANNYPSTTDEESSAQPPPEPVYNQQQIEHAEQQYQAAWANLQKTSTESWTQLTELKVPIGWCSAQASSGSTAQLATTKPELDDTGSDEAELSCTPERQLPHERSGWWLKILGLLITMVALSQGAPFWFDLLKKVVNLRLAGDAPDEKKK